MEDEAWVRETLARSGWPVDDEAFVWLTIVHASIRRSLQPVLDADLAAVAPEVDLDPSRAPTP